MKMGMIQVGRSKTDITFFEKNCGMLGYGMHFHTMQGVETQQFARTYIFKSDTDLLVYVCADLCFSTILLKQRILHLLSNSHPNWNISEDNLMISAQHTHSTAGGYTQYLAYNFSMPGFKPQVLERYSEGIHASIVDAYTNLQPAHLLWHTDTFDSDIPVCFNRSIAAFNKNNAEPSFKKNERHLACDREMKLLRINDVFGNPIGSINWFGVHTTSVSNRYRKVCYDNKGYAADFFEKDIQEKTNKEVVMTFAQDATGDVSPNFKWSAKHREFRGMYTDDYESASFNGQLQFQLAKQIFQEADSNGITIDGDLDCFHCYVDMSSVIIDPSYTGGLLNERTSDPTWGMSFLEGTTDGKGASKVVGQGIRLFLRSLKRIDVLGARLNKDLEERYRIVDYYKAHHPKHIIIDHASGRVAGAKHPERLVVPSFVDPAVKNIKYANKVGYGKKTPWIPRILPLQIFVIGTMALIGIPAEITTIAGKQLRETLRPILAKRGVEIIQLCPYANSYAGYITTPDEYKLQLYEGGHTLFGKWTLSAYRMEFAKMANQLLVPKKDRESRKLQPEMLADEDIWRGADT